MSDSEENPFGGPTIKRRSISSTGQPVPRTVRIGTPAQGGGFEQAFSDDGRSNQSEYADLNGEDSHETENDAVTILRTVRKSLKPTPGKDLLKGVKIPPHHLAGNRPKSSELPPPKVMPYPVRVVFPSRDTVQGLTSATRQVDARGASYFVRQQDTAWIRRASQVHEAWKDPVEFEDVLEAARILEVISSSGDSPLKEELLSRTRQVNHDQLNALEDSVDHLLIDLVKHVKALEIVKAEIAKAKSENFSQFTS